MFSRLKKSIQKAGKSVEEGLKKKGGASEASEKPESHRKSTASTPTAADKGKPTDASPAAAESHRAASEHSEAAAAAPAAPRSRATTPVAPPPAATSAEGEEDQVTIPTPPIRTPKRATSAKPEEATPGAGDAVSNDSIVFSESDSASAGSSLHFASENPPSPPRAGQNTGESAPRSGARQRPASPDAANLTNDSSFDIHVEDDGEQATAAPATPLTVVVEDKAAAAEAAAAAKKKSSRKSARAEAATASESAADAAGKGKRRTAKPAAEAEAAGTATRRHGQEDTQSRAVAPATSASVAPTVSSKTFTRSRHKTLDEDAPPRGSSRKRRGLVDAVPPSPSTGSSHSASHSDGPRRERATGHAAEDEESLERLPSRRRHRSGGFRLPAREDEPQRSSAAATRGHGALRPERESVEEDNEDRQARRARSTSRREGDRHGRSRDRSETGRRHSPSRSPSHRRAFRRTAAVDNLDGGALVQECLREATAFRETRGRESTGGHGRHQAGAVVPPPPQQQQQRTAVDRATGGDGERRVSRMGRVSPLRRHRRYRDDGDDDDDDGADAEAKAVRGRRGGTALHHDAAAEMPRPHQWRSRSESPGRPPPPLRADPGHSASFHRLSFYDDGDNDAGGVDNTDDFAYAAVARPERFQTLSERRRRRAGAHDEEDGPEAPAVDHRHRPTASPASSTSSGGAGDERRGERSTASRSRERRTRADRRRDEPPQSSPHNSFHKYNDDSRRGSTGDGGLRDRDPQVHPDYYFSTAPRRRGSVDVDWRGDSWHSRSHQSRRLAASPLRDSPPRSRRSSLGAYPVVSFRPHRDRYLSPRSPTALASPVRERRAAGLARVGETTPLRRSSRTRASSVASAPLSEKELLDEVEWKLEALEQQLAKDDAEREEAMMRSPFERLYHLNNRRDRDERRRKVFHLSRLERVRDRIISGSLEEDIARREERLRRQEEMLTSPNGVFVRLYQNSSPRRASADNTAVTTTTTNDGGRTSARDASADTTGLRSRPTSRARSRLSTADARALSDRLYAGAAATKAKKEESARQSVEERQRQQAEELLIARLTGQLVIGQSRDRATSRQPPPSPAQLEESARAELDKLRKGDPEGYERKVLRGRVLSSSERDTQATRLWKHGYISKEKLEARKEASELKDCTFQPTINAYPGFARPASRSTRRRNTDTGSGSGSGSDSGSGHDTDPSPSAGHHDGHTEKDRCKELYRKGMQAKGREEALRDERDREMRRSILRSRMASDHHFRRRVELDPALAERFMKSLVV
ncbi:hypothetical protein NESM_000033700 [Novymonas esmeraldas]|uniref:Uncharacterized protein n=1 Tax=Novymonas esmeraldas TaxID=1808958 RepID=A0AAW0F0Z3_9TRYP